LTGKVNKDIRLSYYGGIVEVYKPYIENGYYYDVNSQYPYVMSNNYYPIGNPIYSTDKNLDNYFGYVNVKVKTPINIKIPLLPHLKDGKLLTPIGEWEGWYFSEELKYCKKHGYEFEIIEGYKFEKSKTLFKEYIDIFYKMKLDATLDGNNVKKQFAKDMLNWLYLVE
jgi:hypothetical protein